ncbi:MAG TPA: DNRLRE domain-containing protein, partial [Chitinophagaceae bacterium]|nr:DNRLRE domain-containing protein [Chitinophagaceae bacterium]
MQKFLKRSVLPLLLSVLLFQCSKDELVFPTAPEADAGPDQAIQLPVSSVTLNGTGTTKNGHIVGYLWSLVSGPNVPVINSPSSKTTTVTQLVAGSYLFQFMVVDTAGLTGVDTTRIQVNPSPVQTLTIQPTNNPTEKHLMGNATLDESAFAPEISGTAWTKNGDPVYVRGLLQFDLSSIPSSATILMAKLTIYSNPTPSTGDLVNANSGSNNALFIRRVTTNWNPASTGWLTQPSTTSVNQISIPHTSQSLLDLVDIDVKNLVSDMHASSNNGFMIMLQNEV